MSVHTGGQQLDECRLPRTVHADDEERRAVLNNNVDMLENHSVGVRVHERHVSELDLGVLADFDMRVTAIVLRLLRDIEAVTVLFKIPRGLDKEVRIAPRNTNY